MIKLYIVLLVCFYTFNAYSSSIMEYSKKASPSKKTLKVINDRKNDSSIKYQVLCYDHLKINEEIENVKNILEVSAPSFPNDDRIICVTIKTLNI